MDLNLNGKTAIITGSIQGIGKQIAATLAGYGASVIINNHREPDVLEKVAQEIRNSGGSCKAVLADITNKEEAQKLIDAALEFGSIDILINNAGGLIKRVPVAEFDAEHFDTVFNVNLKTVFLMSHLVIEQMKKQKSGKIIHLSSQAAHDGGGPGAAAYAAAKGGVWTFTKSLAKEVAPFGVTVNCVSPGFIDSTAFHTTFTPKEARDSMPSKILLGRSGKAEDIANVVLFLASHLSDYLTGQSIEINGGLYMP